MKEIKCDVGLEILEGLRELRSGEHGRVINVPEVIRFRKEAGLRNNGKSESDEGI
ncbi:MAG: hypothetical protein OXR72_03355 [Gemmatimonadota bacterium]|nr:hypothetical protein [Gemmatimonadota bacterium]